MKVKPVIIITVDEGPDENPRYPKVLLQAISYFKKYDLDSIFIAQLMLPDNQLIIQLKEEWFRFQET
jgi:hypothetical protein